MKKVKARVASNSPIDNEIAIYVAGLWRIIGTPYSVTQFDVKVFKSRKSAKRGAERVAKALGIKLEWVD